MSCFWYSAFTSKLLTPIGNRLDEWKKSLTTLEKDHDKGMLLAYTSEVIPD
jgi:hypothetical protein